MNTIAFEGAKGRGWVIGEDRARFPQALARYLVDLSSPGGSRKFLVGLIALAEGDRKAYPTALYELVVAPISTEVNIPEPENWTPTGLTLPVIVCEQFGEVDDDGARAVTLAIANLMTRGDLLSEPTDAPVFRHTVWRAVERINGFVPSAAGEKGA